MRKAENQVTRVLLVFFLLSLLLPAISLMGQEEIDHSADEKKEESYPEKIESEESWEKVLNFPGRVIVFPFKTLFDGAEWLAGKVYIPGRIGPLARFFTSADGLRRLRPTYSTRSGAGLKLIQENLFNEGSRLKLKASMGYNYRQKYEIDFRGLHLGGPRIIADVHGEYRKRVDESYYGIGPETQSKDRMCYAHEHSYGEVRIGLNILRRVQFAGSVKYEYNNILSGANDDVDDILDHCNAADLAGLENRVRLLSSGIHWTYDSRNSVGGPMTGQWLQLSSAYYLQMEGDDYQFFAFDFDFHQYIHLYYGRKFILRIAGRLTESLPGRTAPFYHLAELGRRETIRGFRRGRFRDFDMVLGSLEYHYPLMKRPATTMDAFLFVDAGQVANNIFKNFQTEDLQTCVGIGIRMWSDEDELLRFMVGRSAEEVLAYFTLGL